MSNAHGTEAGFMFSFVEVDRMFVSHQATPRAWLKTAVPHEDKSARTPIRNKWIYAFRFEEGGHFCKRPHLWAEYAADERGRLRMVPGHKRMKAEPDVCSEGVSLDGPWASLPSTTNGEPNYWFFVVSRIRLACASLDRLCRFELDRMPEFDGFEFALREKIPLMVVDLANEETLVEAAEGSYPALPAIDFLRVAYRLQAEYERAADQYVRYVTVVPEMSDEQQQTVINRALKYSLAQVVHKMVEDQPSLLGKVQGYGGTVVTDCIATYEKQVVDRKMQRERAALRLRTFLRSPFIGLVESWYRDREEETYDEWIEHVARLEYRLEESVAGVAHIENPSPANQHALDRYIFPSESLRQSPEAKKYFSTAKKALGGATNLWGKYMPWYYVPQKLRTDAFDALAAQKHAVQWLNELLGVDVMKLEAPKDGGVGDLRYKLNKLVTKIELEPAKKRAEKAVKAAKDVEKANKDQRLIKGGPVDVGRAVWADIPLNLQLAVDTINNFWKIAALIQKAPDEIKAWDYVDAANGVNGLAKNLLWEKLKDGSETAVKNIGLRGVRIASFLGVLFDLGMAYKDVREAMDEDDMASAFMAGVAGVAAAGGGVVSLVATFLALTNPALALAFAAVQGAAAVAAFILRDDKFENFVEHCVFGRDYGTSNARPTWADGSYASWKDPQDGLARQIRTAYNLITTFKVVGRDACTVEVELGYYDEDMELVLRYFDTFTPSRLPIEVTIALETGESTVNGYGNEPRDLKVTRFPHGDRIGRVRVEFDRAWKTKALRSSYCVVLIRRAAVLAGHSLITVIPQTPKGLNDFERHDYGTRKEVDPPEEGLAYPLSGPRDTNTKEKTSL